LTRFSGPIAALAATTALAVGGCGGSSHEASTADPPAGARTDPTPTTQARAHRSHTRTSAGGSTPHAAPGPHRHGPHGHHGTPAGRLPISELRQRAEAACATAKRKEAAVSRPADFNTNARAAASFLQRLSSAQRAEITGLHQNPPASIAVRYSELVGDLLQQQLLIGTAAAQARSGQRTYVQTYASAAHYGQQAGALAHELALPTCG
jgi:hypothetical protein